MKQEKKHGKKLLLKKWTIAHLGSDQMGKVYGGTSKDCLTEKTCPTDYTCWPTKPCPTRDENCDIETNG